MSPKGKLFVASIASGAMITLASLFGVDLPDHPHLNRLSLAIRWPVALCEKLAGSGPPLGSHGQEATPVQFVAALVGVGLMCAIYSSICYLAVRFSLGGPTRQSH